MGCKGDLKSDYRKRLKWQNERVKSMYDKVQEKGWRIWVWSCNWALPYFW